MQEGKCFENTNLVDGVISKWFTNPVPLIRDAHNAIKQQLAAECQRIEEIRQEKDKDAAAYHRYLRLQKEMKDRSVVIDELIGMLGPSGFVQAMEEDRSDAIGNIVEIHTPAAQLRTELPLWKAVRWFLEYHGEARIGDVLIFLEGLNSKWASRNAVESALRMHPEAFQIRKVKREKFISLKGD